MRIARDVDKQIAKQAIDQPGAMVIATAIRNLPQRDLELVERVVPRLVDARSLASGTDELPENRNDSEG